MAEAYFPPPEAEGGWRRLIDPGEIRRKTRMIPHRLEEISSWILANLKGKRSAGLVIRHGWIVHEWTNATTTTETIIEIKSAAKAFAALAIGMAIDDAKNGRPARGPAADLQPLDYDRPAYDYIPQGRPLSDPAKARITIRQLIHHCAGILPECTGVSNYPPKGAGFWEFTLGMDPSFPTARVYAEPGSRFLYGTYDIRHLSPIISTVSGMELGEFYRQRLFGPCGIKQWRMDTHGGNGTIGPHDDFRLYTTARELGRMGYLMLRDGLWADRRILPQWLMTETFRQSLPGIVPEGFTYHWLRKRPTWPACVPDDLYYTSGAGINFCIVVPSLDLIAVRVGDDYNADWHQVFRDIVVRLFSAVEEIPAMPTDTSRPTVAITSPRVGQTVGGQVEIRGTAQDADEVARVEVSIDGCGLEMPAEGTNRWKFIWDTTQVADGPHKIFVRAFDRAGNASRLGPPREVIVTNGGDNAVRRPLG